MSPKPMDVAPVMQEDETVPEPAAALAETVDAVATPDTETVLQPPQNTLPEASLPEGTSEAERASEAAATLDEDTVSTETTPETKSKLLGVGGKLKALFALSPKTGDIGPALQMDETVTETAVSPVEIVDVASAPDAEEAPTHLVTTLPEMSLPQDTYEGSSEAVTTLDEDTVSTETTPDTKSMRFAIGGKLKTLFVKSKSVDIEPAMQVDEPFLEAAISPVETVEANSAPEDTAPPQPPVDTLPEASSPKDGPGVSDADTTLAEEAVPTETTPDTKSERLSVGGKLKALFALSPKTVDVGPALQMDEAATETAISPVEIVDVASAPDAMEASAPDDKAAALPPLATLLEASSPNDTCEDQEASDAASSLDEETTVPTETKSPHPSVGVKLKSLFVWSPKPAHVGPAMQTDETIPEEAASSVKTLADASDPDVEAALQSPVGMLPETSPCDDIHVVQGSTEAVMKLDKEPQTQLQSAPTESGTDTKSRRPNMSQKLKILFARPLKPVDEEPTMQADDTVPYVSTSPSHALDVGAASICDTSPQPPMRTPSASNRMWPSSDTAILGTKADDLSGVKDMPPEAPVKKDTRSTANAKAFHTMSEAALALKNVTDRMVLQERDDASAAASLHRLMSRDVLRPFTDDLVNRVYGYLSAIGSSAPCIEPVRLVTESGVLTAATTTTATTTTTGDLKRDLVVKRDSDMTRAFAEGSVKAMVKQLLERLLPLPKDSDTSGNNVLNMVTYMIAKEAVKTITLDHLTLQREETDTESSYTDSESSGSGEYSEVTSATSATSADDSSSSSDEEDDLEMKTDHQNTQKKTIFSLMRVFNAFKSSSVTPS
ncbi:nascent polypeptide-associated complex subunit alpha, muscle-specific form-like [Engraulis encrasicolus]|uniref:nascent polypeptide-associated complex subunit alpha, muscle-specific form-like n=1 Tax=Engraulis encrasicolus TaxID=184585 RepID=UPI002FD20BC9